MAVCGYIWANRSKNDVPSIVIFGVFLSPRLYGFSAFVGLPILQKRCVMRIENSLKRVLC